MCKNLFICIKVYILSHLLWLTKTYMARDITQIPFSLQSISAWELKFARYVLIGGALLIFCLHTMCLHVCAHSCSTMGSASLSLWFWNHWSIGLPLPLSLLPLHLLLPSHPAMEKVLHLKPMELQRDQNWQPGSGMLARSCGRFCRCVKNAENIV